MNQKKLAVIQKAVELMTKSITGEMTTLDLKNALRHQYPNIDWTQNEVSSFMIDIYDDCEIPTLDFTDNGTYRTYTLDLTVVKPTFVPQQTSQPGVTTAKSPYQPSVVATPKKEYSIPYGVAGKFVTTDLTEAKKFVADQNLNLHFSEKRKEFVDISTMDMKYVFYALRKELANASTEEQFDLALNGKLMQKYKTKNDPVNV